MEMMRIDGPGLIGMVMRAILSVVLLRRYMAGRERDWLIRRRVLGR